MRSRSATFFMLGEGGWRIINRRLRIILIPNYRYPGNFCFPTNAVFPNGFRLVMLYIRLLFALFTVGVFADLHQLHHTAILVRQDVTVLYIQASEINEARPHLEVTACWNCECNPPDIRRLKYQRRSHRSWIEDFNNLERVYMNMQR